MVTIQLSAYSLRGQTRVHSWDGVAQFQLCRGSIALAKLDVKSHFSIHVILQLQRETANVKENGLDGLESLRAGGIENVRR